MLARCATCARMFTAQHAFDSAARAYARFRRSARMPMSPPERGATLPYAFCRVLRAPTRHVFFFFTYGQNINMLRDDAAFDCRACRHAICCRYATPRDDITITDAIR